MKPLSTTNSTVRFKPAPFAETKTRSNSNAITISKYTKRNETKTKGKDIHHDFHFPIQINETKLKKAIFFFPRLVIWTRFQRGERLGSEGTRHKRPFSFPGRAGHPAGGGSPRELPCGAGDWSGATSPQVPPRFPCHLYSLANPSPVALPPRRVAIPP
jgi:hypothetical protein